MELELELELGLELGLEVQLWLDVQLELALEQHSRALRRRTGWESSLQGYHLRATH